MANPQLPRDDDPMDTMDYLGPTLPAILREAADSGLYDYKTSRVRDPEAHLRYSDCSRANVLYDHIAFHARDLVQIASGADTRLKWQFSENKRATEILCDPGHAFRIKRVKANRGGLTTGVETDRLTSIKARKNSLFSIAQWVLPFHRTDPATSAENRIWITMAFDLDDVEESFSKVFLGMETKRRFLWKLPLPEAEPNIIARLPAQVADRMIELRKIRTA